jgi:pilus assembly protein Flp/PilA
MVRALDSRIRRFLSEEDGPTAVEYATMLALIIVICLSAVTALGTNANATFSSVSNALGGASGGGTSVGPS